jgi:hypothetical protein
MVRPVVPPKLRSGIVVLSLLAGARTEEARAITWDEVDLTAGTVAVYRPSSKPLTCPNPKFLDFNIDAETTR